MTTPNLTIADIHGLAMFLDFDGTLVEISETPDAVAFAGTTRSVLTSLQRQLDGALAIVTGREIGVVDEMLAPFRCPVAGIHGLTRRDANGHLHCMAVQPGFLDAAEQILSAFTAEHRGLLVERKSHAIALHFRGAPEREAACLDAMAAIVALDDAIRLVHGKMVIEARPAGGDKGTAVDQFMAEEPFVGRRPFFAGDDITDEDAFRVVNARGGVTLKIGHGASCARYRLNDTAHFLAWLAHTAGTPEGGHSIG